MKETGTKVCTWCKEKKPTSEFYLDNTREDKLTCWCGACMVFANHKYTDQLRLEVLTYYGGGTLACVECGENRLPCLSIDHINGGGHKHRRSLGISGWMFYRWLRKQNYPLGYQTLCMNCQFIKEAEKRGRK